MAAMPVIEQPDETETRYVAKPRNCLRCSTVFASEWVGERICPRCKTSTAWRTMGPRGFAGSGTRR